MRIYLLMSKENVYKVINSVWKLAKEFEFKELSSKEWENLIESKRAIYEQLKGTDEEQLALDMCRAVEDYYQRLSYEK